MNKLEKLISAGKTVKGLKGFVECETGVNSDKVYVPLKVLGLEPRTDGLQIRATTIGPCIGVFVLRPKDFIESEDEVRNYIAKQETEAKAEKDRKTILGAGGHSRGYGNIGRVGLIKQKLIDYVRNMNPRARGVFVDQAIEDELVRLRDDKPLGDNWSKQVNSTNVRALTELAVGINHGVSTDPNDWDD